MRAASVVGTIVTGALVLATGTIETCRAGLHVKRDQENRCVAVEHSTTPPFKPYSLAAAMPNDPIAQRRIGRVVGGVALIGSGLVMARFWPTSGILVDAAPTRLSLVWRVTP